MAFRSGLLNMFAKSPFKPLQKHMEKAHGSVVLLESFFQAVFEQDWDKATEAREQISQFEHQADKIKMDLRQNLPKNLFLPVPRMDLLELMAKQEVLPNVAKDITGIVVGRKMVIPDALKAQFLALLKCSIDASKQAKTTISELDELLESGFRGHEVEVVEHMLYQLNGLEHEADERQIQLRQGLFNIESELPAVEIMFLYKIFEKVGRLADAAQDTGSRLKMLTAD